MFLPKNKSGYLRGVFHRDEIGDIDLAYGDAPTDYSCKGLAHIFRKHMELIDDIDSVDDASTKTFDEFLESPDLKFSIKNEEQREAAQKAYDWAAQNKPDKWKQYAIVDMDKPSKISFADNHPCQIGQKRP